MSGCTDMAAASQELAHGTCRTRRAVSCNYAFWLHDGNIPTPAYTTTMVAHVDIYMNKQDKIVPAPYAMSAISNLRRATSAIYDNRAPLNRRIASG